MKKYLILILSIISLLNCYSCKKTTSTGSDIKETKTDPPVSNQDYGFIVVYTNDYVYTDPTNAATTVDGIEVSINNTSQGKMTTVASATKVYYGTRGTVSVKLPIGSVTLKTITTSGAIRTLNATIAKNDTTKVKIDYSYKDPNSNSYYIEYYDNGTLKKYSNASTLPGWIFYVNNYQALIGTLPGCSSASGTLNFDGPRVNFAVGASPLDLRFKRSSWKLKPSLGSYTYNTSMLYASFENAGVFCNYSDSYAKLNVAEVKIVEDMGLEKRGYYSGTFDAIVYYQNGFFGTPVKHTITNGKFTISMGGISFMQ